MEADHPHSNTDVEEVCDKMYLKESKSHRETTASLMAVNRSNREKMKVTIEE
jgi:hypothetical protein